MTAFNVSLLYGSASNAVTQLNTGKIFTITPSVSITKFLKNFSTLRSVSSNSSSTFIRALNKIIVTNESTNVIVNVLKTFLRNFSIFSFVSNNASFQLRTGKLLTATSSLSLPKIIRNFTKLFTLISTNNSTLLKNKIFILSCIEASLAFFGRSQQKTIIVSPVVSINSINFGRLVNLICSSTSISSFLKFIIKNFSTLVSSSSSSVLRNFSKLFSIISATVNTTGKILILNRTLLSTPSYLVTLVKTNGKILTSSTLSAVSMVKSAAKLLNYTNVSSVSLFKLRGLSLFVISNSVNTFTRSITLLSKLFVQSATVNKLSKGLNSLLTYNSVSKTTLLRGWGNVINDITNNIITLFVNFFSSNVNSVTRLSMVRGDNFNIYFQVFQNGLAYNLTGCSIWFTVKRNLQDVDSAALIQKTSNLIVSNVDGLLKVNLVANDTNNAKFPNWYFDYPWDLQVKDASGNILTETQGTLSVYPSITTTKF